MRARLSERARHAPTLPPMASSARARAQPLAPPPSFPNRCATAAARAALHEVRADGEISSGSHGKERELQAAKAWVAADGVDGGGGGGGGAAVSLECARRALRIAGAR